jgi:hypothetical protein
MRLHDLLTVVPIAGVEFAIWLVIPANKDYRNIPITNESMPLSMRSIGRAR